MAAVPRAYDPLPVVGLKSEQFVSTDAFFCKVYQTPSTTQRSRAIRYWQVFVDGHEKVVATKTNLLIKQKHI